MNLREKETICKEYEYVYVCINLGVNAPSCTRLQLRVCREYEHEYEYVCVCINLGAFTLECTKSFSSTYVVFTFTLLTSCLLGIKKKIQ